ncbi:MAG TPA: DEAD/DEAH box helicase [Candidatus Paceibacterota bacterium]|nr:DEAD/DEAH box helicase [Candidatus Paceibacterota bacterium]
MKLHGLFVGIDKYKSPFINDLTCSSKDAEALYSLFADTLGGENLVLLTNETATRATVLDQFERLKSVAPDDLVVLVFSGHGSDSHHLILHDTDALDLANSALDLNLLTELFASIPAKNTILFLDCCFAGGAGAKVFHPSYATKAPVKSIEELLKQIGGEGRLIFNAASFEQEAIEDRKRGHSLFSFNIIEGLKGAPEVINGGKIPVLSLIEYVTKKVSDSAKALNHKQDPVFVGKVTGQFYLPILSMGQTYAKYFPNKVIQKIGGSIDELKIFGFSPDLLSIWQGSISSLNALQQSAINDFGVLQGNHLLVSAPTSSGKTMVGELAALKAHAENKRTYFLLPTRALVNDKYEEFHRKYVSFGLRVIRSTGEIDSDNDALMRGKFDIALLTYEKFLQLVLNSPHLLRQIGLVVIDEVQMIADKSRGVNLEFIITLLKLQKNIGIEPQLIALSGVIGDTNNFENWLGGRLLKTKERPVPLEEGIVGTDGAFRFIDSSGSEKTHVGYVDVQYRKGSSQDIIIPLVKKLVEDGEKVIVFRETKPIVLSTARYLSRDLGLPKADDVLSLLPTGDPSGASAILAEVLNGGIAFHNADLYPEERLAIEDAFRDPSSKLRVIVSTTTLAMGVNTPAWSVVIAGLKHPPNEPYSVAEYKNMVGRAGRKGFSPKGKAFLICASVSEADSNWTNYVRNEPEEIVSRFADGDPMSMICRVLATASAARVPSMSEKDIVNFIEQSFGAYVLQQKGGSRIWGDDVIKSSLELLSQHGLVEKKGDQYSLTDLGKAAGESGIKFQSVLNLVEALTGFTQGQISAVNLISATQVTEELNDILFPVHSTSHQERTRWQGAIAQQNIAGQIRNSLRSGVANEAEYTRRCKKISAVLMWIQGIEIGKIESSILQHMPSDIAAGAIKATADRTRDLLEPVCRIARIISANKLTFTNEVEDLSARLELGIPQNIVWLGKLAGKKFDRPEYMRLSEQNKSPKDLFALSDKELATILSTDKMAVFRDLQPIWEKEEERKKKQAELPMPAISD